MARDRTHCRDARRLGRACRGALLPALVGLLAIVAVAAAEADSAAPESVTLRLPLGPTEQIGPGEAPAKTGIFTLGGKGGAAAVLDLNVPLIRRLVLEPDDIRAAKLELHVAEMKGEPGDARVNVYRAPQVSGAKSPEPGTDHESRPILSMPLADALVDGWLELPGLARLAQRCLKGGTEGPQVVVRIEGRPGQAAPELKLTAWTPWPIREYLRAGDFRVRNLPRMRITVRGYPKARLFDWDIKPQDGVYCRMRDGKLYYGDKRLRLWGVCRHWSRNPERQAERVKKMGFNAVRCWGPTTDAYTAESMKRGEFAPGGMDGYDRYYAALKKRGVFVMSPSIMYRKAGSGDLWKVLLEDDSWLAGGDDWEEWKEAMRETGFNQKVHWYIDERARRVFKRHARNFLTHRNPYTGKTYAEEEGIFMHELANETGWVKAALNGWITRRNSYFQKKMKRKWNEWLRERYKDDTALREAWGKLEDGESLTAGSVEMAPFAKEREAYPERRGRDHAEFWVGVADGANQEIRSYCRSLAPKGVGVNVVPFSFDTQHHGSVQWNYCNAQGDVICLTKYVGRYYPRVALPPEWNTLTYNTVQGRATVLYEVNACRPNPYRTEFPMQIAALASWQDWDGVFWHYMQEPGADWAQANADEHYLIEELALRSAPQFEHLWFDADPVMCSALALAGQAFRGFAIDPAPKPLVYKVGGKAVWSLEHNRALAIISQTYERGARIAYDPEGDYAIIAPKGYPLSDERPEKAVKHHQIHWDRPNGRLIVDTPTFKAYTGRPVKRHTFAGGIVLSGINTDFVTFAMASADGKPLTGRNASERIYVTAVFHAKNTSFEMDIEGIGTARIPTGQYLTRIKDKGRAPAVVDRVTYRLEFPGNLDYRFEGYDFALRKCVEKESRDTNTWEHDGRELYMGVLKVRR